MDVGTTKIISIELLFQLILQRKYFSGLLLITMQVTDETEKKTSRPPTIWALMKDKYILLAAGNTFKLYKVLFKMQ